MNINRRQLLTFASLGVAGYGSARAQTFPPHDRLTLPTGSIIRTLREDLSPSSLLGGATLFHEHLSARFSPTSTRFRDDVDLMIEETRAAARAGIACIVDAGHPDIMRSLEALTRITRESGMPVVASGGFYVQRTYPADIAAKSVEEISDDLVHEARVQRLGAFGEIGQEEGDRTPDEEKVFKAIAQAHLRTGLPIYTHNPYIGRRAAPPVPLDVALRQLDLFEAAGVEPHRVALGHVCCLDDPKATVAIALARRGAFVGFDRVTLSGIIPDEARVVMATALIDAGYATQLLLSSDFAVEDALTRNGGPGLAQTATVFAPMLLAAGVPEDTVQQILVDNPRRFLAFVPISN
jgi:phosphotriesterase-related protein